MTKRFPWAAWAGATFFGVGHAPVAPGTFGAVAGLVVARIAWEAFGWSGWQLLAVAAVLTPVAVWASQRYAEWAELKDPSRVVADEVVGQIVAVAGAPAENDLFWLLAFGLFRVFDIWKPGPVRRAEALPGGTGIVADDLIAGAMAALVLVMANWFNR